MFSFLLLFRNLFYVIKILFKQEEQKALVFSAGFIILIGTIFYFSVEHMSLMNAFYFSIMTLTTVGYGDLYPITIFGKIFTIFYVLIGIGLITTLIANFNHAMVEHHKQKKRRQKNKMK